MIEVHRLHKTFGRVVAVDEVSFTADRGEIFGLLGPNGAGKTTTMRMIYGAFAPTSGETLIDKVNIKHNPILAQSKLGVLPDGGNLYKRLTARENIRYFGELHGMGKAAINRSICQLTELLGMGTIIDRKTAGFSQGERMKVSLARALVHNPDYVLLDEPTNGLDVLTTRAVRSLLQTLKQQGKCVIFSSHLMHEVANLCDRVGIIQHGKVVADGTIATLIEHSGTHNLEEAFVHYAYGDSVLNDALNTEGN